jgi:hypothetical protein
MPLPCNIDACGKLARLIYGIVLLIAGLVLAIVWAWPGGAWWAWAISVAIMLGGGFAIFEARVGWCAVRAMGFKTPM